MDLILASESKYRKALLNRLGLPFRALKPLIDEDSLKINTLRPKDLALFLAKAKAESLVQSNPHSIIIGGDQLVHIDGEVLGKPHSKENALKQLTKMSGKTHELVTATVLVKGSHLISHLNITKLTMKKLTNQELANYIEADSPLDCAGSYKIEEKGIALFDRVETDDFTAIMGLPLMELCKMLHQMGMNVFGK